ncbi:MAG: hypothetical protein GEU83_21140 [Pseudonocardiaceae bacterium]|nr:hypothetical protein [Pseudonocardiaceae bacterium]
MNTSRTTTTSSRSPWRDSAAQYWSASETQSPRVSPTSPATSSSPSTTPECGLWIPNTEIAAGWDRAHPVEHTRLVHQAITDTDVVFARLVRLLKHWRDRHSDPLYSWNIKALALECITTPMPLSRGLQVFFTHAARELDRRLTPDPADVAGPIQPNLPRDQAVTRLRRARDIVTEALTEQAAGRHASAQQKLHWLLPDVIEAADANTTLREMVRSTAAATTAPQTRAWAP